MDDLYREAELHCPYCTCKDITTEEMGFTYGGDGQFCVDKHFCEECHLAFVIL